MKRRISAILAADIVGYSKLVAEDEEEMVRRLAAYRTAFDEMTGRFGGRVVNAVGDAVLAEFPSSVDAVRCAMEVQESTRARNLAYPPSRQMSLCIGITVGDVVDREGQLFGDGVNIAARLEGLSPAGGICVSRTVYEQVANKLSVKFEDIGQQRVKNIPDPIHAYIIAPYPGGNVGASAKAGNDGSARVRNRLLVTTALVGVLVAASVAASQFYRPWQSSPQEMPSSPTAQQAGLTSPDIVPPFDEAKVRALAASQSIPLPRALKVLVPAATLPPNIADYLGAWGGEKRWNRGGRQALLVVESIDGTGVALGVYAQGPPPNQVIPNRNAARFAPFVGSITADKGLAFTWGPSKFTFKLMPDRTMWGKREAVGDLGAFDLSITLERIE